MYAKEWFAPMSLIENPYFWVDGYKFCHADQYPEGTEWMVENWTARKSRIEGVEHVVFFGLQGVLGELTHKWEKDFFNKPIEEILQDYDNHVFGLFGKTNPGVVKKAKKVGTRRIRALHSLGYWPIKIKALPEGTFVPIGVPMFSIECTLPQFAWFSGYLETQLSSYIWGIITAATIANIYSRILTPFAEETGDVSKVFYQAGDFSMRGMMGAEVARRVGSGHLVFFGSSATVPARGFLRVFYNAPEDVAANVPSTEHTVMCCYGENEENAYTEIITVRYPDGNVSIVSDTYDLWGVVDNVLPKIKRKIIEREGKVVIRPDSGDPVKIICGDPDSENETIRKGIIERLYEIFGGTVNSKGYKELNVKIGVVYGDSITPARARAICEGLKAKGFATTNILLGIGSYTYQYVTRDTFGFALKATAAKINGEFKKIQKRPATDNENFKKSLKGMFAVVEEEGKLRVIDGLTPETYKEYEERDLLKVVFEDGKFLRKESFTTIRERAAEQSKKIYAA